jgi:hypothetical protein
LTLPINQTHQAVEQVVVQDAQRRMAVQLLAFDIFFNNTAAGSSNIPDTIDDCSKTEISNNDNATDADDNSADKNTSDANDELADDEESESE